MSTKQLIYRGTHGLLASLLLLTVLLCAAPAAQAAASEEVTTGWVDLQAHVPEDFKGSVNVLVENKATGETQIISSYALNDYANSAQLPLGQYTVVSAFTSEDSFIYEAFTETQQFTLKDEIKIEVTVKYNPEGEGILANLNTDPEETSEPSDTLTNSEEPEPSDAETSEETAVSDVDLTSEEASDDSENDSASDGIPDEDSKADTVARTIRNLLLSVAATLAFLLGTTLLVVYIRFKFGND